ncbi:MAG: class I SAM-dependent methyltransferase [Bacteroidetes bacterium]|nr:class I SAM-dependent methyltransferase [Bacteroidota bacterium]
MYGKNWDQYYIRTYGSKKKALWDVPAEEAVGTDYTYFSSHLPSDLPILDLGCGTGTQSVFLSKHFPRVLGVDVSAEAVRIAQSKQHPDNIEFGVLDITDEAAVAQISAKMGDLNIYMRGVLHQILDEHLPAFQSAVKKLLGNRGRMYCVEVSDGIRDHFRVENGKFSELPERLRQVFISNLPPKGVSLEKLNHFFPKAYFQVISSGDAKLQTNLKYAGGEAIYIPAVFTLLENVR